MSLQSKLTLLFTGLIGGLLAILGLLVYGLVNSILLDQIDQLLSSSAQRIINGLSVTTENRIISEIAFEFLPIENQYVQIWKNSNEILISKPSIFADSLDENGLRQGRVVYRNSNHDGIRMRVLTIPLETSRGPVGILQVGIDLTLVDITLSTLAIVLIFLLIIALIVAAIISWIMTRQTLQPLMIVTEFAKEITETNDLSRRIPISDQQKDDEVGQLIFSFNETLGKLDQILISQKQLVTDISHELRTPLTVIKGEVGIMKKYKQYDLESLVSIENEVDRLTRLVGNLLFLSQAETGEMPMDFRLFSLDDLICEVFNHVQTLAAGRLSIVMTKVDQIEINGDRDRIKQVLLNLLGNAIQYTPDGGKVTIQLEKGTEFAKIFIQDNGPGIAKKDLQKIFDRFYRGEKSRTRSPSSGFGLGLSISEYIINLHKGTILVESEIGVGTLFSVHLPIKNN
ncbi:MAG: HAMP domain-containing sensor histidine kinase [Anaerolineaceae bacterium]|nr:HAMP domain-containing sensor histidine kinase [Anaerolineaceae bacterium]